MNLRSLSHPARIQHLIRLGREVAAGGHRGEYKALLGSAEAWERWLGTFSAQAARDEGALLAALEDPSRQVAERAWGALLRVGSDAALAGALEREQEMGRSVERAGRALLSRHLPQVQALVARLAHPDRPRWLDLLPLCAPEHLEGAQHRLEEHGSPAAWRRLAQHHPQRCAGWLASALRPNVDSRLSWRLRMVLPHLLRSSPDAALDLVEALFAVEGEADPILSSLRLLARRRPIRTFDLIRRRTALGLPARLGGLMASVLYPRPDVLGVERICHAIRCAPYCLPEGSLGRSWLARLSAEDRAAVVECWAREGVSAWGAFLLAELAPGPEREAASRRWSCAAQDSHGCIAVARLHDLPRDLREAEAARHLWALPWLQTRLELRRAYAALLPWVDAEKELRTFLGHPEGPERAAALLLLISTVRHDRKAAGAALALVRRRKNEQDPVRMAMIQALAALPMGRWSAELVSGLRGVVQEALDAADLSAGTSAAAQALCLRALCVDPEAGLSMLSAVIERQGWASIGQLEHRLRPAQAAQLDPHLARLTRDWYRHHRSTALLLLTLSLGRRLRQMPQTIETIDRICLDPTMSWGGLGLRLLRLVDPRRASLRAIELYLADPSALILVEVARSVSALRSDLLQPWLDQPRLKGRWANGQAVVIPDFGPTVYGWTPDQQEQLARHLMPPLTDPRRSLLEQRAWVHQLARLRLASPAHLCSLASDPHPALQTIALRALPYLDGEEGLKVLLGCFEDDRARVAIYALRRCLSLQRPEAALRQLAALPMEKVTVAKEVLRLMGELGGSGARDQLVALGQRELHRDVRIALLRALWDHMEHPPAWALFEAAARGPDPVLASRLCSMPMGRMSSAADERLCGLLGGLLRRPEAEARGDLLGRAALLPLRDKARRLQAALMHHLGHSDPDEARQALRAVLQRMEPAETPALVARLAGQLPRRPQIAALVDGLFQGLQPLSPAHHRAVALALVPLLAADRLAAHLCLRLQARCGPSHDLAERLSQLSAAGHLHHDAISTALELVGEVAGPGVLCAALAQHSDPRMRRVALAALVEDARPEHGWNAARRARLAVFRADPSLDVAAPATWTFPPDSAAQVHRAPGEC